MFCQGREPLDYIRQAYKLALQQSQDTSTQNGALLIDESGLVVCGGVNHYPSVKVEERPEKYAFVEHAERAAIYRAARAGVRTHYLKMVCPWAACADCARAILLSGIKTLYIHDLVLHQERPEWRNTVEQGNRILKGHVEIIKIPGEVGLDILFGGKVVRV